MSGYFSLLEINVTELGSYAGAFDSLRAREINGILIHNFYAKETLDPVVERLEKHDPAFLQTWFPEEFKSWFYGRNLNLSDPELKGYFEEANQFHQDLEVLFPAEYGVRTYLAELLSRLDGGRSFEAAPGPNLQQEYMFTTLRCHLEGGFIHPHIDYEYLRRRSYSHLRTLIDSHIFSFVLTLTVPEKGGTLEIFNHQEDLSALEFPDKVSQEHDFRKLDSISIPFAPGSLFIFDSGRYLHGVSPVIGKQNRWTVSSFMALSKTRESVYCWG